MFCSLLFVFLEIAKKSLNLFNVSLGTRSKLLKHPVAGIADNFLKKFALAVVPFYKAECKKQLYCATRCYLPSRSKYISGSSSNRSNKPLDWSKCLFCQKDTGKKLVCPADYSDRFKGAGYKTIGEALQAFNDLGCLPKDVNLTRMDDGDGLEKTFVSRRAKFHSACSLKFNKNEIQRATKRKMHANDETSPGTKKQFTRQKLFLKEDATAHYLFCDEPATYSKPLHKAATLDLEARVRQCAVNLQDQRLLARLSGGDLIATGAEYHSQCLVSLYSRDRDKASTSHDDCDTNTPKRTAFAALEDEDTSPPALEDEDTSPVFQLSVLWKLYVDRVNQLGGNSSVIHSTRLKEKILRYFLELDAYNQGRNVLSVAKENVGNSLTVRLYSYLELQTSFARTC